MGITNGFAGIGGIVGPVVVGALTKYDVSIQFSEVLFYSINVLLFSILYKCFYSVVGLRPLNLSKYSA